MTKNINGDIYSDLITRADPRLMNGQPRNGLAITNIIIHHNAGTNNEAALNTWLKGGLAGTSAHYQITPNEIIGAVGENSIAYHAGNWYTNQHSIGLEHLNNAGAPNWTIAEATYENSAKLIADICKRYGLPINRTTIKKHSEVSDLGTACPGGIDIDRLVRRAQEIANGSASKPNPAPKPNPTPAPNQSGFKYAVGTKVTFGGVFLSSDQASKANPANGYTPANKLARNSGTITKQLKTNGRSTYLIDNGFGWINDGDVVGGSAPKPSAPAPSNTGKWVAEKATFIPNRTLPLTVDASGHGGLIANIGAGQAISYDAYMIDANYVWIRQPRSNGYGYMATGNAKNGKRVDYWGSFK